MDHRRPDQGRRRCVATARIRSPGARAGQGRADAGPGVGARAAGRVGGGGRPRVDVGGRGPSGVQRGGRAMGATTGAGVEIEHHLSEFVAGEFGRHAARARSSKPPPGRSCWPGMPGSRSTCRPMIVLSAALASRGVPCRTLGANLPVAALAAAVRRTAPSVSCCGRRSPRRPMSRRWGRLPRTRPRFRTFAAGPGWADLAMPRWLVICTAPAAPSFRDGAGLTGSGLRVRHPAVDHPAAGHPPTRYRPFGRAGANDSNGVVGVRSAEWPDDRHADDAPGTMR